MKKHCKRKENACNGLISTLDMAEKGISELEDMSIEISNWKCKENSPKEKKKRISENCEIITKGNYNYNYKWQKLSVWIKKHDPTICCLQQAHFK